MSGSVFNKIQCRRNAPPLTYIILSYPYHETFIDQVSLICTSIVTAMLIQYLMLFVNSLLSGSPKNDSINAIKDWLQIIFVYCHYHICMCILLILYKKLFQPSDFMAMCLVYLILYHLNYYQLYWIIDKDQNKTFPKRLLLFFVQ